MDESEEGEREVATFGPLREALREHVYPVTSAELIETYGGFEFEGPDGVDRLEDALGRAEEVTFRDPRDVRDAILDGLAAGSAFEANEAAELLTDEGGDDDAEWSKLSV
ncbi:DUF5789 family protein [Halorubrum vacuolatum]|uniref:DUF2795 domain-containing protein n=1 Tax=Halorubrum vacuolatum TaxID=63740 RepID=A0A238XMK3_HALVU|nr:hypothetical protein [Halorubrum vacuolatum]SNR59584.1 hypothetical protein SAMN06264855_11942 [Halorubrum vacuolatum]